MVDRDNRTNKGQQGGQKPQGGQSGNPNPPRNEQGEIHHHVNIYVNSEAIESLKGLATALKDGDEVSIIPALAGGQAALAGGRAGLRRAPTAVAGEPAWR